MKITDYSKIANKYDDNQYRNKEIRFDLDLEEYINNNEKSVYKVLDLSCGTGTYLEKQIEYLSRFNIQWYGLDSSIEMLKIAKQKLKKVDLLKGYAEKMPYQSGKFDFISNNYAFHHYKNKAQSLDEIYRVLMIGGVFKLHNISIQDMVDWWVYYYFPSAYDEDLKRFWDKKFIFNELSRRGFEVNIQLEYQMKEVKVADYLTHAENRDISVLTLISDIDYIKGLEKMRYDVKTNPNKTIVVDFAELFFTATKL